MSVYLTWVLGYIKRRAVARRVDVDRGDRAGRAGRPAAWPGLAKSDSASALASAWPDPGLEVSYDQTTSVISLLCARPSSAWLGLARPSSA